ncbi:MAG: hypothetical protein KTR13_09240 [Saprospiraceae bacterium]|nr:hypothetical protein [Saprospiraceae bacterium]
MKLLLTGIFVWISISTVAQQVSDSTYVQIKATEDVSEFRLAMNPILSGHSALIKGENITAIHVFSLSGELVLELFFSEPRRLVQIRDLISGFYIIKVNNQYNLKLSVK